MVLGIESTSYYIHLQHQLKQQLHYQHSQTQQQHQQQQYYYSQYVQQMAQNKISSDYYEQKRFEQREAMQVLLLQVPIEVSGETEKYLVEQGLGLDQCADDAQKVSI